jgi:hypothetical protein
VLVLLGGVLVLLVVLVVLLVVLLVVMLGGTYSCVVAITRVLQRSPEKPNGQVQVQRAVSCPSTALIEQWP